MRIGEKVSKAGFFGKAVFIRGQSSAELERRLGYRTGRLSQGWWLLFMLEVPNEGDFELRGYSQMAGGVAQGHLPSPPDGRNSEQVLRDGGYDLQRIKQGLIRDTFTVIGPNRLAKVIPKAGEFGAEDYPPGSGIPQWTLVRNKYFTVAAFVGPGQVYNGSYV